MGVLYASVSAGKGIAPVSAVFPVLAVLDQPTVTQKLLRGQVDGLLEAFDQVSDPRKARGKRHRLMIVLGLAQLATACGAVGFDEIAEVAADLDPDLIDAFGLVRCPPSSATFRRVLCAVDTIMLDEALCRWVEQAPAGDAVPEPGVVKRVLSADGKTMRGARRRHGDGKLVQDQVVAVLDHDTGGVLAGQQVTGGDEIAAVRALISRLIERWGDLHGVVLVTDAKHTQHKLVEKLNAAGGWWVLPIKANQPTILETIKGLPFEFKPHDIDHGTGHGRRETRTVRVLQVPEFLDLGLAGARQIIKIGRHVKRAKHPGAEPTWTRELAYLLTSMPFHAGNPARLAQIVRGHWQIESRLHWARDTAYHEDRHTARTGHGPTNLTCLRNTAISRHRATGADNIAHRLRACARDPHRALRALTHTTQPVDQL